MIPKLKKPIEVDPIKEHLEVQITNSKTKELIKLTLQPTDEKGVYSVSYSPPLVGKYTAIVYFANDKGQPKLTSLKCVDKIRKGLKGLLFN